MRWGLPSVAILLAAAPGAAPPPAAGAEAPSAFSVALAAGRKALAAGKTGEARNFLLEARSLRDEDTEVLAELYRLDAKDPEARALWLLDAAEAASDSSGRVFLPKGFPAAPADEADPLRAVIAKRAAALQEVRRAAKGMDGPTMGSHQRWLRGLAERLADGSPGLRKDALPELGAVLGKSGPDQAAVLAGLRACIAKAKTSGRPALGLAAARVLRGLRVQAAARAIADAGKTSASSSDELSELDAEVQAFRLEVLAGGAKPFSADALLDIPPAGGPEFQDAHREWTNPGLALSPKGLYRIETTGGLQVLQAAVRWIEPCHARLEKWFGSDPFKGNQGRIRLCPTDADMESEGAPYWWAAGWQQGRMTTVHACFCTASSLCSILTHEITHRFDGALHPGIPAWLAEGRAVHTELCSTSPGATSLDESRVAIGSLVQTRNAGFGSPELLNGLIEGTGDYRDNYSAGYALWIFLTSFRGLGDVDVESPYRARIPAYLASCGPGGKGTPGERFRAAFLDGAEGRAGTIRKFAAEFDAFLDGFTAASVGKEPPWLERWFRWNAGRSPVPEGTEGVDLRFDDLFDGRNWPASRSRSSPAETGTDQARRAAAVFLGESMLRERVLALEWAVARDDPTTDLLKEAEEAHAAVGEAVAAWTLRRARDALFLPPGAAAVEPPPKELAPLLKAVGAAVDALDAETDRALKRGMARLGLALRSERDALALAAGLPARGLPDPCPVPAGRAADTAPVCGPWGCLATGEILGRVWAPLGPKASPEFHRSGDVDLCLGSTEESSGERWTRWFRNVFVESPVSLDGTYSVECGVRADSAYFEAMLVVGKEGEDRGFTIALSGGDEESAIRSLRSGRGLSSVHVSISDGRPREEHLARTWRDVEIGKSSPVFRVTAVVAGPSILVLVNGEPILRHRRLTGAPIRGAVGFGVRHGTVTFVRPVYRRHRTAGPDRRCACAEWDAPIPWNAAREATFDEMQGRRLEPAVDAPGGGLLLWYTEANLPLQMAGGSVRGLVVPSKEALRPWGASLAFLASFPAAGRLLCGTDGAPPTAREAGVHEGCIGIHGPQPEFAGRIWREAAGARGAELAKGDLPAERRTAIEGEIGPEIESPWCLWFDEGGIVRRAFPDAAFQRPPGLRENLHRYFLGW